MLQFDKLENIGDGAFGVVMKCRNKETGELVAIKKMKQKFATFDECCQLKEIKSLRKIKHPNVMRLLQFFREDEHLYMVFELLHGSLYKSMRDNGGPFTEAQVRNVTKQILQGVAFVHKEGFFHRDLKPENLLWKDDTIKIADFGLAREIRSKPPYTEYVSTRWYRAPEIVLRSPFYNSPVDIWATGCIMAEMFTQKPLFQGTSETDQLFKIFSVMGTPGPGNWPEGFKLAQRLQIRLPQFTATPLSTMIPNASAEAIEVLTLMLTLDPAQRPSASKLLHHPWFSGPIEPVMKMESKGGENKRSLDARKVEDEAKMKDDESIAVDVTDLTKNDDVEEKPPLRRFIQTEEEEEINDPSFDDIFENL